MNDSNAGKELVALKVKRVAWQGGWYPPIHGCGVDVGFYIISTILLDRIKMVIFFLQPFLVKEYRPIYILVKTINGHYFATDLQLELWKRFL